MPTCRNRAMEALNVLEPSMDGAETSDGLTDLAGRTQIWAEPYSSERFSSLQSNGPENLLTLEIRSSK